MLKKSKSLSIIASVLLANSINAVELDSISVVSSTIDDKYEAKETAVSSTSIITSEDVKKINPQSVADILNKIPGVTSSLTGTDSLKVHIRGIDNQMYMGEKPGVAIVIDGVPVQETTGKINVDLDNIESIKVIKGSASYLYGNDALAGAVIITTKRPKGESYSTFESEVGSFGTKRVLVSTNQNFENSALQLQGSVRDSDGYWDDAFVKIKSVNGKYQYFIDESSDITFGADYTKRETGDGNSVSGETEAQENPTSANYFSYGGYYNSDLIKAFMTYTKSFENESELMLRVHKYIDDKTSKSNRTKYDNVEKWEQDGAKAEYKIPFEQLSFMTGVDFQRNTTDEASYLASDGSLRSDYETKEDIGAIYSELNYQPIKDFIATANVRHDRINHEYKDKLDSSNDVDPDYNTTSYRLGFNYKLNENMNLYSSVSTGFRTPTVGQISNNLQLLVSDPTLDIPSEIDVEKTYNYEIGVRGKTDLFTYDASIFQIDRKDYIGRVGGSYVDTRTNDLDDEDTAYDNLGDMRSKGLELTLTSKLTDTVSVDLAYTFLQAKFTEYNIEQRDTSGTYQNVDLSGNYVSRTPKHTINLSMDVKASDKLTISPELVYKGSYYADEANRFKQGGYTVVNLRTNYKVSDSLEVFGRIDNLFDNNYYMFVNVNSSALATMEDATIRVAPPRAFYAGLRYKF